MGSIPRLEDIPEVIHNIQSRLPVKEVARTCILSKSWLNAWSTIPILGFREAVTSLTKEQETEHLKVIDHTLIRYLYDNIPIQSIHLKINIENQDSASLAEKWTRPVASKSSLHELSLTFVVASASFTLPDNILSGINLTTLRVSSLFSEAHSVYMMSIDHPVINCVSLRVLNLQHVHISQEVLDDIFSTCSSLVKIKLLHCKGFNTIKVKNLSYLYTLRIISDEGNTTFLKINHVPNLTKCSFDLRFQSPPANPLPFNAHSLSLGSNLTQLYLRGIIIDDACLDMIKSKFPFLKILTLNMKRWRLGRFDLTCASMEILSLRSCQYMRIDIQLIEVNAPKLHVFLFEGKSMPRFVFFPATDNSRIRQIVLALSLSNPLQVSFFVKMRKAFKLAMKCDIKIKIKNISVINLPFDINVVNLRKMVGFPAKNVQQLSFFMIGDEGLWERSQILMRFLRFAILKK